MQQSMADPNIGVVWLLETFPFSLCGDMAVAGLHRQAGLMAQHSFLVRGLQLWYVIPVPSCLGADLVTF